MSIKQLWQNFLSYCNEPCVSRRAFDLAIEAKLRREERILAARTKEAENERETLATIVRRLHGVRVTNDWQHPMLVVSTTIGGEMLEAMRMVGEDSDRRRRLAEFVGERVAQELWRTRFIETPPSTRRCFELPPLQPIPPGDPAVNWRRG